MERQSKNSHFQRSAILRPKSACVEVPGSGLEAELTLHPRCNSLPPCSCSEPTVEQTNNTGMHHNCSAYSTGHPSPSAPILIAEKKSEGNGMDDTPVPLDLSLQGASRSAVAEGAGGRKRKDSSRSSSRSSKGDEQPSMKAMRLEGNVPFPPLLPLLTRPINDADSKNATTSRANRMPQLTFMAGGDLSRTSVWTPQLAAAAASLFANGGRNVDGGRPIGADRLEDNSNEPASPQLMGNVSDDDWESMMEISNTDEAEKIRAIVGDNAAPVTDPNQCLVCRRILSCKSALQMHYRTHTGERPFKCRICQRAFTTKGNLKTHMGVHRNKVQHSTSSTRVNPLLGAARRANPPSIPTAVQECPICQKRFSSPPLLHQHVQQHTRNLTENGVHWDRPADRPLEPSTSLATKSPLALQSLNAYLPFGLPFPAFNHTLPPLFHFPHLLPPPTIMPATPDVQLRQRRTPSSFASHHRRPQSVHAQSLSKNGQFSVANLATSSRPTSEKRKEEGEAALNLSMPKRRRGESPTTPTQAINDTSATIGLLDNPIFFSPSHQKRPTGNGGPLFCPQLSAATAAPDVKLPALPRFFMLKPPRTDPRAVQTGEEVAVATLPKSNNPSISNAEPGSGRESSNGNLDLSCSPAEKITRDSSPAVNPLDVMEKMCAEAVPEPSPRQPLPLSKHQCPICRKHFSSSSALQIHTRTHTGDKPFVCEVCKRAFTTRGNLKVHMGTHDIHQQPSRRGRRIFDASENGYPSPPRETLDVRGGGGNVPVTIPSASTSNGFLPPPAPDARLMFGVGEGGGLALFNPLVQLCQNPLLATNLLLNAVKSSDGTEDVSRMGALAAFLRLLPVNGHLKASDTDQANYTTNAEENRNEELVDDEEIH